MFLKPSPHPLARDKLGLMVNDAYLMSAFQLKIFVIHFAENVIQFEKGTGNHICILFRFGDENIPFCEVKKTKSLQYI